MPNMTRFDAFEKVEPLIMPSEMDAIVRQAVDTTGPVEYPPWMWAAATQLFLEGCLAVVKEDPLTVEQIARVIQEYHEP